jgi:hypothetical protein
VPSIILSVISAMLGVCQLLLMGTADLLEPAVNAMLALTESSKDTVGLAVSGASALTRWLGRYMHTHSSCGAA